MLVVNYVVQATVDETWWDFGEPEDPVTVQHGVNSGGAMLSAAHLCARQRRRLWQ